MPYLDWSKVVLDRFEVVLDWFEVCFNEHSTVVNAVAGAVGAVMGFKTASYLVSKYMMVPNLTILDDLPNLGKPRKGNEKLGGRAIICGGSIAGLLAAAVCADHFESVLIVEPEAWTNDEREGTSLPEKRDLRITRDGYHVPVARRTRVPQYDLNHFLQPPVQMGLARLFPNFDSVMRNSGYAPVVMRARFQCGGIYVEDPYTTEDIHSGAPLTLALTRDALETTIRRLVRTSRPNVQWCTGTVTGFLPKVRDTTETKGGITSNRRLEGITFRTGEGHDSEEVIGDLVIDATGPSHLAFSKWLGAAGFPLPNGIMDSYDPKMHYSTSVWTIPPAAQANWPIPWGYTPGNIFGMQPDVVTGDYRSLFLGLMEDDKLLITTGGWGSLDPPRSVQEIRTYTAGLPGGELIQKWLFNLYDVLERHEEECRPYFADCKPGGLYWIKYHAASQQIPSNFVALGDSVMKVNPVYGQGVTKAVMDITTLDAVLRTTTSLDNAKSPLSTKFFFKLAPRVRGMWDGTKAVDYGFTSTVPSEGETLEDHAFTRSYAYESMMLARTDKDVHSTWWHVNMQLAPGIYFFAPWFLFRMGRRWLFS